MTIASQQPITVAVAEFEDILSRGLQALIDDDSHLRLVASGLSPERLAATLADRAPDVAILNYGSLSSPAELRELHAALPQTRLMVLADTLSGPECRQMIGFGATACLAKSSEARDLVHAIYLASRGVHVLVPNGAGTLDVTGPTPLTAREGDVLELLQTGRSNAEIAATLHVSVETIRTHVRNIYRKLGVNSRRQLRAHA